MIFAFWFALSFAYVLLVGLLFSGLFAWWDRSAKRKAEEKRARQFAAAQRLARYHHVDPCICGLIGETAIIRIDVRCIAWTQKVCRAIEELRRARMERIADELRRLAEKRNEPGASPARIPTLPTLRN